MNRILPIVTAIITFLIIVFLFNLNSHEKQNKKVAKYEEIPEIRTKFLVDKFVEDNSQYFEFDFYKDLKFDNDKIEFKNLNELTKQVIKINLFVNLKKKIEKQFEEEKITEESKNKINEFYFKVSKQIDKEKKILYDLFPTALIPADKFYLDQIK